MQLEELKLLDLQKCNTVDDIIKGMSYCSFGARMLGEVATSFCEMIQVGKAPLVVYDGRLDTALGNLLKNMAAKNWIVGILTPEQYQNSDLYGGNIMVVGPFSERFEEALYKKPDRPIFVNQYDMVKPGQVRDGYFPDAVFTDPRYIIPLLYCSLQERLEEKPVSIDKLMEGLARYGGVAGEVSHGAQTLLEMVSDPECTVFFTLSGAMTIAKMGLVICDMIDLSMVNYIASTGALMSHGLVESVGLKHFKYDPKYDDSFLAKEKLNRVTDTLEPESNLDHVEEVLDKILESISGDKLISPRILHQLIGKYLAENYPNDRGILKSCYEKNVPVEVPAFVDSEIGNDLYIHNYKRKLDGRLPILMDMESDSQFLIDTAVNAKRSGIFTLGGGVPRNNTQNVAPLIDILNVRFPNLNLPASQFSYGCRIAPDKMHYGHLGGCTYSEGMSWRKMDPNGRFSEIHTDATQVFPFLVKYVMEKMKNEIERERKFASSEKQYKSLRI